MRRGEGDRGVMKVGGGGGSGEEWGEGRWRSWGRCEGGGDGGGGWGEGQRRRKGEGGGRFQNRGKGMVVSLQNKKPAGGGSLEWKSWNFALLAHFQLTVHTRTHFHNKAFFSSSFFS